jgi:hypothetical protein
MTASTPQTQIVHKQLHSVEGDDASYDEFVSYFAEDGIYQFANFNPRRGRKEIRAIFDDLHPLMRGDFSQMTIGHDISIMEQTGNTVFCQMGTIYLIDHVEELRCPCFGVYHFEGEEIKFLQIFIDPSPLFTDTTGLIAQGEGYKGIPKVQSGWTAAGHSVGNTACF